jgi:hypothetical protein
MTIPDHRKLAIVFVSRQCAMPKAIELAGSIALIFGNLVARS